MIRLKNIVLENNIISADYYPERSKVGGKISVDAFTGEVVHFEPSPNDSETPSYHAVNRLNEIIRLKERGEIEDIPSETCILWY